MPDNNQNLTDISSLGEFGLIDHLTKKLKLKNKSSVKGIGDDAAVIQPSFGKHLLVSKDLLIEGVHFDLIYTPLKHLGYKAVVVNLSDIAAMNGTPTQIIVGIGISSKYSLEAIEEIYAGMNKACEIYNVDFVGGDTTSSPAGLHLSVTVLGEVEKSKITYRSGAKPNDLICVSGDLGAAYIGLLLLEKEKKAFQANPDIQPDLSGHDYLLERHLKPEARLDIVRLLEEKGVVPTSMIDISDGLASEVLHLCKNSSTGCLLYEDKLPIDQTTFDTAKLFGIVPTVAALNGGEDYELLFTISQQDYEKLKDNREISVIGYMTEGSEGQHLVSVDNQMIKLEAQGWDAIKQRH
jgi:thiamine-monophosphate kinase